VVGAAQALTMAAAVRAAPADAAWSYVADDRLGTLEVGKLADVVVLDRDLFATPPDDIAGVGVDLTLVGGEIAYDAERLSATSDSIS
jgi:predicted amidohydrolase YtcJ